MEAKSCLFASFSALFNKKINAPPAAIVKPHLDFSAHTLWINFVGIKVSGSKGQL